MHFTRPRELIVAGLLGLIAGYLLFEFAYASLPRLPRMAGAPLVILAVVEVVFGFTVRTRVREGRMTESLTAARAVALAKASSLLGSLMLGVWAGALAVLWPESAQLAAAKIDLPSAVIAAVCAVTLIAGALWLEHCCRAPENPDPDTPE